MILTQLKLTFEKLPPKTITFRDYKHFNKDKFERYLVLALASNPASTYSYDQFLLTFESVLDKHAPVKRRKVRGNQMPFMNKPLRQAVMRRSKLRNLCHKSRKSSDWDNYRKQRNYCVKLRNKARRDYLNNMQAADVNKNNFWKTIGPFFSNKSVKQAKKLILIEQNDIVPDDSKVAEIFSKHFSEITKSLNIPEYATKDNNFTKIEDPVLRAIEKYKDHPSIVRISSFSGTNQKRFQFKHFYPWEVRTKILTARNKKSDLQVPMMILKQCTDSCVTPLTDLINNIVNDQNWPVELGSTNITPAHKKLSTTDKGNYRPISVLPSISKISKNFFMNNCRTL